MSPLLTSDQPNDDNDYKFVRSGERIAYGNWNRDHSDIARTESVGTAMGKPGDMVTRLVDDAGWVRIRLGRLALSSNSSTCDLTGNRRQARLDTLEIAKRITGKETEEDT